MTELIRVLLADSHQLLHSGLHTALTGAPDLELVGEAATDEELWLLCQEHRPDVLLLAANINGRPLLDTVAQVGRRCPEIRVLALLSDRDEACLQALTESGATGGILKSDPPETLLIAIRAVAQEQPWFSPTLLKRMLETEPTPALTDEELALLRLMVVGKKNRVIASALSISNRTVRRRVEEICQKLGVEKRIEAVYIVGLCRLLEE